MKILRKFLGIDKNDQEVEKVKRRTERQVQKTVGLIEESKRIHKTQTYYFGRALGIIK